VSAKDRAWGYTLAARTTIVGARSRLSARILARCCAAAQGEDDGWQTGWQAEGREPTHLLHDRLEDEAVGLVVHALLQRHVDRVVVAPGVPRVRQGARAGEEVAVLVERHLRARETYLQPLRQGESLRTSLLASDPRLLRLCVN